MRAISILLSFFFVLEAQAVKLSDYSPYKYEVLFTNPVCKEYRYDNALETNGGEYVYAKPRGAYCKSSDSFDSGSRRNSPHQRLLDWIKDSDTREIFLTYLSFSKGSVRKELCLAIKNRRVKVTLILDSNNDPSVNDGDSSRMSEAYALKSCGGKVLVRGGEGSGRDRLGYAHNKVFFVNPSNNGEVRIAFSSGNMSSGTTTHHENWHFVTTSSESYFAQAHICMMNGMIDHADGIRDFSTYMRSCKSSIESEEESDIKTFFIPGEGNEATNYITGNARNARSIDVAAHRFSYSAVINNLQSQLRYKPVRLVCDDDMYWTGVYNRPMGRNTTGEWNRVKSLINGGMKVSYIQTYADDVFNPQSLQLHHNKFFIFGLPEGGAVFTGAGNITSAAFTRNFENFYGISIPEVVEAFNEQYDYLFNTIGRQYEDMPSELVLP